MTGQNIVPPLHCNVILATKQFFRVMLPKEKKERKTSQKINEVISLINNMHFATRNFILYTAGQIKRSIVAVTSHKKNTKKKQFLVYTCKCFSLQHEYQVPTASAFRPMCKTVGMSQSSPKQRKCNSKVFVKPRFTRYLRSQKKV